MGYGKWRTLRVHNKVKHASITYFIMYRRVYQGPNCGVLVSPNQSEDTEIRFKEFDSFAHYIEVKYNDGTGREELKAINEGNSKIIDAVITEQGIDIK